MGGNVKTTGFAKTAADREIERFSVGGKENGWGGYDPSSLVIVRENSICVAKSLRVDGVRRDNGKKYSRYKKGGMEVVSWRSGQLRTYRISARNRRRYIEQTTSLAQPLYHFGIEGIQTLLRGRHAGRGLPEMRHISYDEVTSMLHTGAFPILSQMDTWRLSDGRSKRIGSALRSSDGREFTTKVFGKKNYRKDLLTAVAGARRLSQVAFAEALADAVPIDWVIERLRNHVRVDSFGEAVDLRPVLSACSPKTRRTLALAPINNMYTLSDTVRLFDMVGGDDNIRVKTWRELHDYLSDKQRKMGRVNRPIPQTKIAEKFDGKQAGQLTLVSAKETGQVEEWGDEMHHCIGSYAQMARKGDTNLFGVYEGGELKGNLMLDKIGNVVQLYGKYNANFDPEDDAAIRKAVKSRG